MGVQPPVMVDDRGAGHGQDPGHDRAPSRLESIEVFQELTEHGAGQVFGVVNIGRSLSDVTRYRIVQLTVQAPEGVLVASPGQPQPQAVASVAHSSIQIQRVFLIARANISS